MYIDSHCHLNYDRMEEIGGDEAVVARAKEADIDGMVTICCRIAEEFEQIRNIARSHENVWCSVGTHPHEAGVESEKALSRADIVKLAHSDPKVVGIGESGLDYYYDNSPHEDQQASFRKHIGVCLDTDLPLIVHTRDAEEDTIRIMREEGAGTNLKGVMHCFSSSRELGEQALDMGFYISLSGIVTFNKAQELRDFVKDIPLDRILLETDAPFLAPAPHRGKVNEPALMVHTAKCVAELKDVSEAEIAEITTRNFFTLFNKAKRV